MPPEGLEPAYDEGMASADVVLIGNDKSGTISAFRIDDDKFMALEETRVGLGCSTFAVDSLRGVVHVATKEPHPAIVTLRLDAESGALTELSRRAVDDPLAYLAVHGDVLLGASYHGGWGASWRVGDNGVGPVVSLLRNRNLHASVFDPKGRNAYFVSLGDDVVAQFAVDSRAQLAELQEALVKCPKGSGPRHLIVRPDGRSAYLLTEFGGEAIRFDRSEGGALTKAETAPAYNTEAGLKHSEIGRDPRAHHLIWGADLVLADGNRWLLCSERTESTIAAIELAPNGHFTDRIVLSRTEDQPRGMTASPDGSRVIVVGERSDHASLYRLEEGALVQLDRVATGTGPNWVRFV